MDTLTFISNLIGSLAWPVLILVLLLIFRKHLFGLISLLQKLKYKDLELEFGRRLEQVKTEAGPPTTAPELEDRRDIILKLAEVSPRAAVLEAWRGVENAAVDLAHSELASQGKDTTKLSVYRIISTLERSDRIHPETLHVLNELRYLRNQAAHAPDFAISAESAIDYADLASRVIQRLKEYIGI